MYDNLLLSILSLSLTCLVSGACGQRDGCFTDNSFDLENNLLRVVKKISAGCSKGCCWKSCCGECDMGAPRWRCPAKAKLNRSPSKLCIPEIPFSNFFRSCTFSKESPLPIPRSLFRRRAIQGQLTIEKKRVRKSNLHAAKNTHTQMRTRCTA